MARTIATLPEGSRITDYISLGVIAKTFPLDKICAVLAATGTASVRERDLPAHVVIYYVIALALFMQASSREVLRCLLEGVQWLLDPSVSVKVAGKSGISQARSRLGCAPVQQLHDDLVKPIALPATRGAWYRGWRLVSLDGSTLDVADEDANVAAFGRPGSSRGDSAYPQIRFVSLVENGTHVLFATQMSPYGTSEIALAKAVLPSLKAGMLCLADRNFFSYALWDEARGTGADLLWRLKKNMRLPCEKRLPDGSYLSHIYPSDKDRRRKTNGITVRVIDYRLEGVDAAEPIYRLLTTILDPDQAPADELAALYHERWEIETALDEFKTHLRGANIVLRSRTPDLVRQEFYGLMMAHFAIRGLMHEAALKADRDPDRLSFLHAVRVVRRKLPRFPAIPP
jgi:Insertion element 4 transposase N-terminal/Transposase DDE domain